MRWTIVVASMFATCGAARAGEPPPYPGCEVEREVAACREGSGDGDVLLRCHETAIAKLERDLDARLVRLRRDNDARPGLVRALAAAQEAWRAARDADCAAVAEEWGDGTGRSGALAECRYAHVLARSRWLWRRHEDWGGGDDRCEAP